MAEIIDRSTGKRIDTSSLIGKRFVAFPVWELRSGKFDNKIGEGVCVEFLKDGKRTVLQNTVGFKQEVPTICLMYDPAS
jgi:hypothetical protein